MTRAAAWNVQTRDNIVGCVKKSGCDKSAEVHCPPLEDHGCNSRDLQKFKWEVLDHPPYSPGFSPFDYAQLILQAFRRFTYVTVHPLILPSLYLRHSSFWFSKLSVTSPTSQLIPQPFPCFTYITTHSPTLPLLHLRHSSFSNASFASPMSQDFHLRHLILRPQIFTFSALYRTIFKELPFRMKMCSKMYLTTSSTQIHAISTGA